MQSQPFGGVIFRVPEPQHRPLPEAQIMELQARFAAYHDSLRPTTFRFKPGQLVTPLPGSSMNGAGQPHIVLEIRPQATPSFSSAIHPQNNAFGMRYNMRVLALVPESGHYLSWWVEAFNFEPYPSSQTTNPGN